MPKLTDSEAYAAGFMSKLAELRGTPGFEKLAKSYLDMTPDELAESTKAFNDYRKSIIDKYSPIKEKAPTNFKEWSMDKLRFAGRKATSYGMGVLSGLGAAGVRTGQEAANLFMFFPELADKLIAGKMFNVDEGRGFFGRALGEMNRKADGLVHSMRDWSDAYDRRHGLSSDFNRFFNGTLADVAGGAIGTVVGGSGFLSVGKRILKRRAAQVAAQTAQTAKKGRRLGLGKTFLLGLGGWSGYGGRNQELRDREDMIRGANPMFREFYDPTSTRSNIRHAPTVEEYRKYHTPTYTGTHITGRVRIPRGWWHQRGFMDENGFVDRNMPIFFRDPR